MLLESRGTISQLPQNVRLQVDNSGILASTSLKNPGVDFDPHLTLETHINNISKIFNTIVYINRIKENFNRNTRIIVVQSLVRTKHN